MKERYQYVAHLGGGAYSDVWQCVDKTSGRVVAVKVLKEAHTRPAVMRIVGREIRVLKSVSHPNLVRLLSVFQSQRSGRVHLVFECMETDLLSEIESNPRGMPSAILKAVAWQLLRGVAHLHANNLMHRDIKPANILMDGSGIVKLCDFGFARRVASHGEDHTPYIATRWYRAPELLTGKAYGLSSDIWSIGCTLAELATGKPLFPGCSDSDLLWRITGCLGPLPSQLHPPVCAKGGGPLPPRQWHKQWTLGTKSLRSRLSRLDPALFTVVEACLRLDPASRPTCEQLLAMPYFSDMARLVRGTALEGFLQPAADMVTAAAAPDTGAVTALAAASTAAPVAASEAMATSRVVPVGTAVTSGCEGGNDDTPYAAAAAGDAAAAKAAASGAFEAAAVATTTPPGVQYSWSRAAAAACPGQDTASAGYSTVTSSSGSDSSRQLETSRPSDVCAYSVVNVRAIAAAATAAEGSSLDVTSSCGTCLKQAAVVSPPSRDAAPPRPHAVAVAGCCGRGSDCSFSDDRCLYGPVEVIIDGKSSCSQSCQTERAIYQIVAWGAEERSEGKAANRRKRAAVSGGGGRCSTVVRALAGLFTRCIAPRD